jgi:hypothetical protein
MAGSCPLGLRRRCCRQGLLDEREQLRGKGFEINRHRGEDAYFWYPGSNPDIKAVRVSG